MWLSKKDLGGFSEDFWGPRSYQFIQMLGVLGHDIFIRLLHFKQHGPVRRLSEIPVYLYDFLSHCDMLICHLLFVSMCDSFVLVFGQQIDHDAMRLVRRLDLEKLVHTLERNTFCLWNQEIAGIC